MEQMGAGARVLLALVGVVFITLGANLISTNRYLMQHGVRTTGVVVANRHVVKGASSYYPQVRYVGPDNHTYVVEGVNRPTPQFRVGESVTVYYPSTQRRPWSILISGTRTHGP